MEWLQIASHDEVYRRASAVNGNPLLFAREGNALFHLIATIDKLLPAEEVAERQEKVAMLLQVLTNQFRWMMPALTPTESALARRQRLVSVWTMFLHLYFLQLTEQRLPVERLPVDPNPV